MGRLNKMERVCVCVCVCVCVLTDLGNVLIQAVQLLVCDWLLTTRTEVWQRDCAALASTDKNDEETVTTTTVFADDLMSFQQDLASLRRLAHDWRAAMTKVCLPDWIL